ncbi:hypothetical protein Syun_005822 [Stephania yunnanensis]|uniref:KAT8 regulatory NSL complex subunit 2 n=1 Tax=Stephania yunnanensis TaxID=152371 RepID=A0AAP0KVT8_9MAGN
MVSASKHQTLYTARSSSSKPLSFIPRNTSPASDTDEPPNPNPSMDSDAPPPPPPPLTIDGAEEDLALSGAAALTWEEVVRRRSRRVKQLERLYKDHYWAFVEEVRVLYREYYWKYGKSPFKDEEERGGGDGNGGAGGGGGVVEGSCESNSNGNVNVNLNGNGVGNGVNGGGRLWLGFDESGRNKRCAFPGCKTKAMALTSYCHPHILSDSKQKLYKACTYVIKSAQSRSIQCGKPILSSAVPSLCSVHFQKAEKHLSRALKKAGLNIPSTSKLAPKLHVIIAESVRQINAKRREKRVNVDHHIVNGDKNESNNGDKEEASG